MKSVKVVKSSAVNIRPFLLKDFLNNATKNEKSKKSDVQSEKVTKKSLKLLADELGLDYNDKEIAFTKKMIAAYLKR